MDPEDSLTQDVLAFQQITLRLSWVLQRRLARELEAHSLTVPQLMALRALQNSPSGYSMSELAATLLQVTPTMTGIIDRLVERGLVDRKRHPDDRRSLTVSLTPQGTALVSEIESQQKARMQRILGRFDPEQRTQLLQFLSVYLQESLSEIDLAGPPTEIAQDIKAISSEK